MIDREEIKKYPICDTDIWVYLCLGGILDKLFKKYNKINVADVVEQEISAWGSNSDYKFISDSFNRYKASDNIIVIRHTEISPPEEKIILERTLYDIGFTSGFENKPKENHKGEYVSAIYADHFEIPFMKSNDGDFKEGEKGNMEFPDLVVKNWITTTDELIPNFKEKIRIRGIVSTQCKIMDSKNQEYKAKKVRQ